LAALVSLSLLVAGRALAQEAPVLQVFVREGCPHCAAAEEYLEELESARPELRVVYRWVDRDQDARSELQRLSRAAGIEAPGVPTFAVGRHLLVGFQSPEVTGPKLDALFASGQASEAPAAGICPSEDVADCETTAADEEVSTAVGRVSLSRLGLPLFTIILGLLDGFNPCAMWVLMFLIAMLVNFQSRRRMALVAGTFVLTSGLVYFAFMAAWLNIFLLIGFSRGIQLTLGVVALAIGAFNVKDFFAFKRGVSLSIPESAKPSIYARVRGVLHARTLGASLVGVAALAVLVNFVELLCTAGLPALYTAVLTRQDLPRWGHYGYLALYNVAYVFDDTLMVSLAVITLSRRKLTERAGRWLKLVSGVVMLGLAGSLLFAPEVLR
jgi:glutaredoxin